MKSVLVVAPHADDETLGCGGALLRHISQGDQVHWLVVTCLSKMPNAQPDQINKRHAEIRAVSDMYQFSSTIELKLTPTKLDTIPKGELVSLFSSTFLQLKPNILYVPFRNDAHNDHEIVFDAVMSSAKSFRSPSIEKVLSYETLSETEFCSKPGNSGFNPNVFVDVANFLDRKISILNVYKSELGEFPFPRSIEAVKGLAAYRGAQSGCYAAESFMLIKEIIR